MNALRLAPRLARERRESAHEVRQQLARGFVRQFPVRAQQRVHARHLQTPARPELHAQRAQHRQPRVLRQDRAETTRRCADHRERAAAKHAADVVVRTRQPVDRILEHPGDAIVVFRRTQQHAIAGDDARLQRDHRSGQPVARFEIAVVERDAVQRGGLELHIGAGKRLRRAEQRRVEGTAAETAGDAEEVGHGGSGFVVMTATGVRAAKNTTLTVRVSATRAPRMGLSSTSSEIPRCGLRPYPGHNTNLFSQKFAGIPNARHKIG